jgi:nitrite reductase/ring-hydroxylating ferredoxin subunit
MTGRIPLPAFPTSWYRVAAAADIAPGEVIPLHYFGEDLICYRGDDGQVRVLHAYCAHLGAHIGHGGFVEGNDVVCPFHHWRYDETGRNVNIPYRDRVNRGARLRVWPAREVNGAILVWNGPADAEPDWEPPQAREYADERFVVDEAPEAVENTVDVAHFQYVHKVNGFGAVELVEDGPMLRAIAGVTFTTPRGPAEGFVESELWGLGIDMVRPTGLGNACTMFTITPIDGEFVEARYLFMLPRAKDGDGPSNFGLGLKRDFMKQITQDIPIWEHKVFHRRPKLAIGEGMIIDFRRWAEQFYEPAAA